METGTTKQGTSRVAKASELFERIWQQTNKSNPLVPRDVAFKAFMERAEHQSVSLAETFSHESYTPALYVDLENSNGESMQSYAARSSAAPNMAPNEAPNEDPSASTGTLYRGLLEDLQNTYHALCSSLYQKSVKEAFSVEALIPFLFMPSGYAIFRGGKDLELEKKEGSAAIYPIILGAMQSQKVFIHDRVNASISTIDIDCKEGATLHLVYAVHSAKLNSIHFQISCAKNARVQITVLTTAVDTQNITYCASILGEGGHVGIDIRAGALETQKYSINGVVYHKAQHTTSDQTIKHVGADSSRASFDGTIYIHSNAKFSNAYQKATNLLIGKRAKAVAKPKLEIFTDDVKASHGSTTSYLDKDVMQYFASRGLSTPQAIKLILKGVLCSGLDSMPATVLEKIESYINRVRYEV